MKRELYFSVYYHKLVIKNDELITRRFIVLKDNNGQILSFTNFHEYLVPKNKLARSIHYDCGNRIDFIVKLLNYAFFDQYHIRSLSELSIPIVKSFLNDYGMGYLPDDNKKRTKTTVEMCVAAVIVFLNSLINEKGVNISIKKEDLYREIVVRNKRGKYVNKKVPAFDVRYSTVPKEIFRDMPDKVFDIFLNYFMNCHKEMLMLVALSAFAGLRPSEACNVRREDSALGAGILFTIEEGEITKISIDLTTLYNLRSDMLPVGGIKKPRTQIVPEIFRNVFYECYLVYMEYLDGKKYESNYGPLNLNKQGNAITYDGYYTKFRKIVKQEIVPILLQDSDPEVVNYGHLLMENNISPHIFRHWYSVQLVLNGYDIPSLMHARGDLSPDSALVYLQNKGELEKQYRKVNNEIFGYMNWLAEKEHK